jgi:uncharacterized membrane protein YdjX (TVP38/TMEM64 family)/Fe-S oxidoreductase
MKDSVAADLPQLIDTGTSSLYNQLYTISSRCIKCNLCQDECQFLRQYGRPGDIASTYDPDNKAHQFMAFDCSLCQLCHAVCPVGLNPADMFLEMRRETVKAGVGIYPDHAGIVNYERRGTSRRYTWYGLPEGCTTVLFPGCSLPGTRPEQTLRLFEHIRQQIPSLGIVLDCCSKPSHDLGRQSYFLSMFEEMKGFLVNNGIRKVLVACPSCYKIFSQYGAGLNIQTIFQFLAENGFGVVRHVEGTVTIHDPCATRFETQVQSAVRTLVSKLGLSAKDPAHCREKTLCCGEGGAVGFISPELSEKWSDIKKQEANGNTAVTYCAGCASFLNKKIHTVYLLDLLLDPEPTLAGNVNISKAPMTYWNRLRLKKRLIKTVDAKVSRERAFMAEGRDRKTRVAKRIIFLLLIISGIVAIRLAGIDQYLEPGALRRLIGNHSVLTPIIYLLIYTIAPTLFLPGLPITIAGGILFGPLWGVVYSITGSSLGACLAFLVSRYIARDWVESRLKGPRWLRLDHGVQNHGWKVVAFTRLIPLFPFNLLNYALGLTKIKFTHYALATFLFMLPACIAFVVFSSSLLDVLRGRISPAFVAGLLLIVSVSLLPLVYKRYKTKKGSILPNSDNGSNRLS